MYLFDFDIETTGCHVLSIRQEIARHNGGNPQIGQRPTEHATGKGQQLNGRDPGILLIVGKARQPPQLQIFQHKDPPMIRLQLVNLFAKDFNPKFLAEKLDGLQLRGSDRRGRILFVGTAGAGGGSKGLGLRQSLAESVANTVADAFQFGGGHFARENAVFFGRSFGGTREFGVADNLGNEKLQGRIGDLRVAAAVAATATVFGAGIVVAGCHLLA